MTREIGDILIQQTVDSDYEIERKVRIIERIEKLVLASLNIAERKANQISKSEKVCDIQNGSSVIVEKQASKQEQIEEAKQRLEAGETVREVSQDIPERIVREVSRNIRTQECTQDVHEASTSNVREVVRKEPTVEPDEDRPTRATKTDNEPITSDNVSDNKSDNGDDNEVTEEEFNRRLAEERAKWEQEQKRKEDRPLLEVATYGAEDERAVAMKRLAGLTGLKRAAMAAAIERYFSDKQTAENMYRDNPDIKFAYTLDDYINGARYNIENK